MKHNSWAEIDLQAIKNNYINVRKRIGEEKRIMAVVKANAYGHGVINVAKMLAEEQVSYFAVANLLEAIELRQEGIKTPILVLGWTDPEDIDYACEYDITLTIFQKQWAEQIKPNTDKPLNIHIKLDTGMNRIGVKTEKELKDLLNVLKNKNNVIIEGVFSHLATADEVDKTYLYEQREKFKNLVEVVKKEVPTLSYIHLGNSAYTIRELEKYTNMTRLGIVLYGLTPSVEISNEIPFKLQPAFSLKSKLIHIKKIKKGETVGYGRVFKAEQDMWVGTVPIGYADGLPRSYAEKGYFLVGGVERKILKKICMDQTMIEVDEHAKIGEEVIIVGKQNNQELNAEEFAEKINTINYEVPCLFGSRIKRIVK